MRDNRDNRDFRDNRDNSDFRFYILWIWELIYVLMIVSVREQVNALSIPR